MKQTYEQKHNAEESVVEQKIKTNNKNKGIGILVAAVCFIASIAIGGSLGWVTSKNQGKPPLINNVEGVAASKEEKNKPAEEVQETEKPSATAAVSSAIPPAEQENNLINIIAEAKRRGMIKRAYLTFDDGPSKNITNKVLDVLKKYNIKATFFEVGKLIMENPDVTRRVHDEGHLIANHSYSHDYNALYETEQSFSEEIKKAEQTIENITGAPVDFKLIRFPGGSYNAGDHAAEKQVYKKTLANMGYYYCDWNALNGDAEGKEKNSVELTEYFKRYAVSFIEQDKNLIVLMHDSDDKQATVDSLDGIITYLVENGYAFHRLDEIE